MDTANPPSCLAHYKAFDKLVKDKARPQQLNALVAFGLYMEAECRWAERFDKPTDTDCVTYHNNGSMPYFLNQYEDQAQKLLSDFGEAILASNQKKVLASAVEGAIEAAHKTKKAFARGISEAVVGALVWTVILIGITIIAQRVGIDVIEIYKRAAGRQ